MAGEIFYNPRSERAAFWRCKPGAVIDEATGRVWFDDGSWADTRTGDWHCVGGGVLGVTGPGEKIIWPSDADSQAGEEQ